MDNFMEGFLGAVAGSEEYQEDDTFECEDCGAFLMSEYDECECTYTESRQDTTSEFEVY